MSNYIKQPNKIIELPVSITKGLYNVGKTLLGSKTRVNDSSTQGRESFSCHFDITLQPTNLRRPLYTSERTLKGYRDPITWLRAAFDVCRGQ